VSTIPPTGVSTGSQAGISSRPAVDPARAAAQRAFFEAALGQAQGTQARPSAAAPPAPSAAAPPTLHATRLNAQPVGDEPPARIPRPGTFLNILV
jgi:hypothetical protein